MTSSKRMASIGTGIALSLLVASAPAALGAGHVQQVAAFDPEMGQLPEGVAVADDGTLYATLSPLGQLVLIDPATGDFEVVGAVEGIVAGDFGLIGITDGPDGGIYGGVFAASPDAVGVWRFDVGSGEAERVAGTEAVGLPNDVAFADDGTMYISDTVGGAIWRVPVGGSAESWIADPLLEGTGEAGFGFPLGANGIDVSGDTVYVGVTETAQVVTVPINEDGSAGTASTLVQLPAAVDGVAVDAAGNVYATHPLDNLITKVTPDGEVVVIAEVADGLDAPSSVAIGTDADGNTTAYIANFSIAMGGPLGAGPGILALEG